jgi:hypothetical protein
MNPIHTVGPYLQQFVFGKDADVKGQMTTALREMAMAVVALPDKTNRLFDRASRGDVQFQIAGLRESALLIYAAVQQVLFTFIATGLVFLAMMLEDRGERTLSLVVGTAALVAVIAVVTSVWRTGKLGRRLRERRKR